MGSVKGYLGFFIVQRRVALKGSKGSLEFSEG